MSFFERLKKEASAEWRAYTEHPFTDGLADGSLLAITTDHSSFTLAEKEVGIPDIWKSAIGAPGVEALVPFVLGEADSTDEPTWRAVSGGKQLLTDAQLAVYPTVDRAARSIARFLAGS